MIFKIIGAVGLVVIIIGVITKNHRWQNIFYIIGGLCLEIYSIYILNWIFIILQAIFTLAAVYDLFRLQKSSKP